MAQDYTLPRGKLYFDKFQPGTTIKTGERYIGHTNEVVGTTETENIDHYNSDEADVPKDKSVRLRTDRMLNFITDDISFDNLRNFFTGSGTTLTQLTGAGLTESITVKQGRFYQVGATTANPTGDRDITINTLEVATVAMTLNVDYTYDAELGRIYIIPDGGIADDDVIDIDYDRAATTRSQIVAAGETIEGALHYVADNKAGTDRDYYWPYVSMSPDGNINLKGEEWQQIGFTCEVLKLGSLGTVYIDGRPQ